jgi:hypothetical protein
LTDVVIGYPFQKKYLFLGSCFGHARSKACQYAFNDSKVCVGFLEVSLKNVQTSLQKTITWTKIFGKGKQ